MAGSTSASLEMLTRRIFLIQPYVGFGHVLRPSVSYRVGWRNCCSIKNRTMRIVCEKLILYLYPTRSFIADEVLSRFLCRIELGGEEP